MQDNMYQIYLFIFCCIMLHFVHYCAPNVLVELKLLQVNCNRNVVLETKRKGEKKKKNLQWQAKTADEGLNYVIIEAQTAAKRTLDQNGNLIWWWFLARHNRPKVPLNGRSIAAFFVTAAIELLWHHKAGRQNRRNSPRRNRPNGPLMVVFWAFVAVLARHNWPVFF